MSHPMTQALAAPESEVQAKGERSQKAGNTSSLLNRRQFTKSTLVAGATLAAGALTSIAADQPKRIRVGLIGCGSVSGQYLPQLKKCPYTEVVSLCDRKFERAHRRGKEFGVDNQYPNID